VVFYYRDQEGAFRLVAVYRDAEYLHGTAHEAAWEVLTERGEVARRSDDLRRVFGDRKKKGARAVEVFEADEPIRWRVRTDHVVIFEAQPVFSPPGKQPWRQKNAYDWGDLDWTTLVVESADADEQEGDHEGRVSMVLHRQRERSARIKKAVKARKARLKAGGRLRCEACEFDFTARFLGDVECLEGHHTRPLGDLPPEGAEISVDEICLLCPTCHRVAHRTGRVQLAELTKLLVTGR